jgi:membrane protein implicated in regulation of membrane protease activity
MLRRGIALAFESLLDFLVNTAFYAYLAVFVIGFAWIVIGLVLGGLESMIDAATDLADGDSWGHQQVGLSPFSPLMLAVFGMLFGVTGMTLNHFTALQALPVLLITIAVSVGVDGLVYWGIFSFFVKAQSTSLPSTSDAIGTLATVATRIDPGRTGTINYEAAGRLQVAGARSVEDAPIESGEVVRILSIQGAVAQVKKER